MGAAVHERAFRVQAEYILANYDAAGSDIEPREFYLYGTLSALPNLDVGARYDQFEPDKNGSAKPKRTTLTATYRIRDRQQIDLNYEIVDDDLKLAENLLTVQFQIAY